jgi:nicotinamidase-related amidase
MGDALLPFPLTARSVHLCVDMQRIFFGRRPVAGALDGKNPAGRRHPGGPSSRTNRLLLLELMLPLAALCPPATVVDKTRYSGFAEPKLLAHLREIGSGRSDYFGV